MYKNNNSKWINFILIGVGATVLLPQGVGLKFEESLPSLDLPRLACLIIEIHGLFYVLVNFKRINRGDFIGNVSRNTYGIILLCFIADLISSLNATQSYSIVWFTGDVVQIYALAFFVLFILQVEKVEIALPIRCFITLGIVLGIWLLAEVIFNKHFIYDRNLWSKEVVYHLHSLKRFFILPMGPYAYVQSFVYAICLFLGGTIFLDGLKRFFFIILLLSVLLFSQMISAIFLCLAIILYLIIKIKIKECLFVILVCSLIFFGFYLAFPPNNFSYTSMHHFWYAFDGGRGSITYRFDNLIYLFNRVYEDSKFFTGFGMGALRDMNRVPTNIYLPGYQFRTDPGSFFIWFFEGGLLLWLSFIALFINAIYLAFKSTTSLEKYLCGGIAGFFIIALSSQSPYLWGQAIIFVGILEYSVRVRLSRSVVAP